MSKFGLRVLTISSVCSLGILAVGCGSSGSKSEPVNASVVAQSAAVISGQTAVSIESSREIAITGELSITDAQTNEAVFKAQNNNATAYGSFSLTELPSSSKTSAIISSPDFNRISFNATLVFSFPTNIIFGF